MGCAENQHIQFRLQNFIVELNIHNLKYIGTQPWHHLGPFSPSEHTSKIPLKHHSFASKISHTSTSPFPYLLLKNGSSPSLPPDLITATSSFMDFPPLTFKIQLPGCSLTPAPETTSHLSYRNYADFQYSSGSNSRFSLIHTPLISFNVLPQLATSFQLIATFWIPSADSNTTPSEIEPMLLLPLPSGTLSRSKHRQHIFTELIQNQAQNPLMQDCLQHLMYFDLHCLSFRPLS